MVNEDPLIWVYYDYYYVLFTACSYPLLFNTIIVVCMTVVLYTNNNNYIPKYIHTYIYTYIYTYISLYYSILQLSSMNSLNH